MQPLLLALTILMPGHLPEAVAPAPVSLPAPEKLPLWREGSQRTGAPISPEPPKRLLFGLGVGFERSGNAMGVPLAQVLAGSPADRAGLTPGTVIAEINGETTVGKIGDACAQMIRDSAGTVTLKIYDPATLKLRTITVEKASIVLP